MTATPGALRSAFRRTAARVSVFPAGVGACAFVAAALVVFTAVISSTSRLSSRTPARLRAARPVVHAAGADQSPRLVGRGGPIRSQPDACLSFAPTAHWNGATVFLDPGHGGVDPGAIAVVAARTVTEKQVTLAVGMRALSLLRGSGYRVVMSRVRDSTVASLRAVDLHRGVLTPDAAQHEIEARNLCANAAHADVLVALHMNAFVDPSASGTETVYCPSRPFAARSRRLAELIQRATLAELRDSGTAAIDRGFLPDQAAGGASLTPQTADYHHLIQLGPADPPWLPYPSLMPGILVEPVFLSNPGEASLVLSGRGQEALARALLDAVDSYFGRSGGA